jgi:deoxyribodipyrimidine photo-lyase
MNAILWFRLDLRLADNPALQAALRHGGGVIPVFIWAPKEESPWEPGAASRWWLHHSLAELSCRLESLGSRLILRRGPAVATLRELARQYKATAIFWNRRYEPAVIARDHIVKQTLREAGLKTESFNGALLHEPWTIENQSGKPFQVFTPFWKKCLTQAEPSSPVAAPKRLPAPPSWPKSLHLDELNFLPKLNWADGFATEWKPGEAGARDALNRFLADAVDNYTVQRNLPDRRGTSRLSPHLHFGEISPRQVWQAARQALPAFTFPRSQFLTELGWREFAAHLLFHFSTTPTEPLRPQFRDFPWRDDPERLVAWQRGQTGYPIVDAGMRELWATGWMHNRVRMIAASFLVKDLLANWTHGARWFWDTLVDADLAQNTLGWQWTAGCGADAAPYFRVFNPVSQGEKFDPNGGYVRRWCPELARLPDKWIHRPAAAPAAILAAAGVELGRDYPRPIISHFAARETALDAFAKIRRLPAQTE